MVYGFIAPCCEEIVARSMPYQANGQHKLPEWIWPSRKPNPGEVILRKLNPQHGTIPMVLPHRSIVAAIATCALFMTAEIVRLTPV
jgi:hypothetical protein